MNVKLERKELFKDIAKCPCCYEHKDKMIMCDTHHAECNKLIIKPEFNQYMLSKVMEDFDARIKS